MEKDLEKTKAGKSSARVSINAFMMGSLFFILTIIWTLGFEKFNSPMIYQLVLAIPFLFISSLFYAKIAYRDKDRIFDKAGWITTTVGNTFILNVIGLMAVAFSIRLASIYFVITVICITSYYIINIYDDPRSLKEDIIKLVFILLVIFLGGVLPLF